jgi:hypothetical protein
MMFFLGRISMFALALAAIGVAPAGARLLGHWPGPTLKQSFSPSQGFEEIALKCKNTNQQNNTGPGQIPDNPNQTPDNPKPKHDKNNPKGGNHPPVVVFKPVNRPGGICMTIAVYQVRRPYFRLIVDRRLLRVRHLRESAVF